VERRPALHPLSPSLSRPRSTRPHSPSPSEIPQSLHAQDCKQSSRGGPRTQDPTVPASRRHSAPLELELPLELDLELDATSNWHLSSATYPSPWCACRRPGRRPETSPDKLFSAGDFAVHARICLHLEQEQPASNRVLGAHAATPNHPQHPYTYTQHTQAPTSGNPSPRSLLRGFETPYPTECLPTRNRTDWERKDTGGLSKSGSGCRVWRQGNCILRPPSTTRVTRW